MYPAKGFLFFQQGDKTQYTEKQFTEFLLVVESSPVRPTAEDEVLTPLVASQMPRRTGSFQLLGDVLTRFSDHCTNTVTQTSAVAKSEIQVLWTAPPAGSGCVTFKATVVENRYFDFGTCTRERRNICITSVLAPFGSIECALGYSFFLMFPYPKIIGKVMRHDKFFLGHKTISK